MLLSYSTWKFVVSDKKKQATKRTFWFRCKHQRACQQVISHMVKHCMPCYTVGQTRSEPEKILFIIYILFMATSLSVLFHCISASWHSSLYHMTHHLQRACSCWSNTRVININSPDNNNTLSKKWLWEILKWSSRKCFHWSFNKFSV